ncbi:ankyrin repeat domain-containing protein 34C [Trichomycterus rosablanca]|uniref:ankyrin repeat domain-containing protein 34C n=1 Tax=Trichomycterus rosablanca TaxID=2290929 RepID=UPI002F35C1AF
MAKRQDFMPEGSPLITAAELGKLRLVRLLVEGGAQINERNQRGETPLLAACRALRADQSGNTNSLRLIRFLLQHHADPNAQDKAGHTPLMYVCMERAGAEVAAALISAGADPTIEDYTGASALVYAINARDQDTIQVLLDACKARGRDIIIIATDLSTGGATVSRRYLNVSPSPDTSPVMCMSPSDIELKTNSPNSESDTEGIFNFRGSVKRSSRASSPLPQELEASEQQRLNSEPWLAIHNPAQLSRTCKEKENQGAVQKEEDGQVDHWGRDLAQQAGHCSFFKKASLKPHCCQTMYRNHVEKPSASSQSERLHNRRNTLPSLTEQNLLQLPAISFNLSISDTHLEDQARTIALPPVPMSRNLVHLSSSTSSLSLAPPAAHAGCNTMRKWKPQEQLSLKHQTHSTGFLPPLPGYSTGNVTSKPCRGEESPGLGANETQTHRQEGARCRRPQRRHSIQLEQMRQEGSTDEILFIS